MEIIGWNPYSYVLSYKREIECESIEEAAKEGLRLLATDKGYPLRIELDGEIKWKEPGESDFVQSLDKLAGRTYRILEDGSLSFEKIK